MRLYLTALMDEARQLRSEHGENPEYDRALCELIAGVSGKTFVEVARELGVSDKLWSVPAACGACKGTGVQTDSNGVQTDDVCPACDGTEGGTR